MARLGDLYQITSGGTPSRKHLEYYQNGTIPWVKTGDLKEKYLHATDENITKIGLKNSSARIYPKDTVLIAMYGATIGASSILKIEAATNQACAAFIKRDDVIPEYLYAFLESQKSRFVKDAVGGAQPNISAGYLKEIDMPLIPIEEQRRIAALLDKVGDLIAKRRAQQDKLDLLVKARFVEMFGDQEINTKGWYQSTVGECCILKSGVSLPADKENEGGSVPYIKVGDMNYPGNEYYITTSSHYVSRTTAGSGVFPVGTVIFPKRGGAIGTNKKRLTTVPICADLNVMGVIAGELLHPSYLMTYFGMVDLGKLDNGSSVPQINNKDISPLQICLPPMELQEKFSTIIKQSDKLKLTIQQSLDKLETLKKALMQQYFG